MTNENDTEEKGRGPNICEESNENSTRDRDGNRHEEHVAIDFGFIDEEDEAFYSANEELESNFDESQNEFNVDVESSREEEGRNKVREDVETDTLCKIDNSPDDANHATKMEDDEEMGNKRMICDEGRDEIETEKMSVDDRPLQLAHVVMQSELDTEAVLEVGTTSTTSDHDHDHPPHRKKKIWENLPVATPVFDAEVVTWDFDRPEYHPRFGKGFQDSEEKNKKETKPREPIFTDEDRSNIFRLIGKVIGIILALPLYFIYWLLTFGWVSPLLCVVNEVFAKPIGKVMDCILYVTATIAWFFYHWVLIPLYKCTLVYPARAVCKFTLVSTKLFLMGVDWIINTFIAAVKSLISSPCCQCLIKSVSLTSKWIYRNLIIAPINFVIRIPSLIAAYIVKPVCTYVLRPFWQGILSGVLFMRSVLGSIALFVKKSILLPCYQAMRTTVVWIYSNIVLRTYKGVVLSLKWTNRSILIPFWDGFVSGLSCMYKHILKPIGKGFIILWGFLVSSVLAFRDGFVSGLSCMYKHILKPIGKGVLILWGFLISCVLAFRDGFVSGLSCMYKHILKPIGEGVLILWGFLVSSVLFVHRRILMPIGGAVSTFFKTLYCYTIVPLKNFILLVASFISNAVKSIGEFILNVVNSIGSFVAGVGRSIASLFGVGG